MTIKNKKIAKRACAVMLSMAMVMGTMVPSTTAEAAKKGKIKSVTVTNVAGDTLVLKKGEKFSLKTKVTKTGKISKKVTYKSSKSKIVKVSKSGKLTAVKNGTAKITVKSKANKKKKAVVTVVVNTPVESLKLNQTLASALIGETVKIDTTVLPENATVKNVSYTSSDENLATVDADGLVTCKAAGDVTITATVVDGRAHTEKCLVKIFEPEKNEEPKKEEPKKEEPKKEEPKDEVKLSTPTKLSKEGYTEKWKDEFNGTELNRDDWNVELHEPGWVNSELQQYVDSKDNIYIKDGNLYLVPIKTGEGESATYTSGRVNTMGKHDFKYGLFEATLKVPAGKGYLPAFWMMPTNENLYGQWPKCGEIDAMEVMGQDTNLLYGTIHYGEPHGQQQGKAAIKDEKYIAVNSDTSSINGNYAIENGKSYADEFHTYSVEWEPDHITWYVDGIKYHEVTDWFSAVEGGGEVAFPAPFDQPFYMILNLAVGGSWVGYPDETTTYGDGSAFIIDSVKVYQKDASYYEEKEAKTEKAEKVITYKEADKDGNYVTNGNFATAIDSEKDWTLHLESDAAGTTCAVANNSIKISPAAVGGQTHSVQLKQAGLPLYRGVEYTLSFDAKADTARTMVIDIEGPDKGWTRYFNDKTIDLTTENKHFSYDFVMENATDANSSLEFNLGKQDSTVPVTISNVVLKIKDDSGKVDESKLHEVRADGNYVYNGSFSEGTASDRTKYWEISDSDKSKVSVTNINNERRLKVVAPEGTTAETPVVVKQENLPLVAGKYALSYKAYKEDAAENDKSLVITVGKASFENILTDKEKSYDGKFEFAENDSTTITLKFTAPGTYYVDDVFVSEDAMIKNGKFNAGIAGFTQYTYDAASSEYTIDSQKEDNAFDITIKDTGTQDWHVQLFQDGISLEKGKFYRLKFDAKSELVDRAITAVIQRNGSLVTPEDWTPYFTAIKAELTDKWQTFGLDFQMKNESDPVARFGFAMGAIDEQITKQHRVLIDNISLVEISEDEANIPGKEAVPANEIGKNLLKNPKFEVKDDAVTDWSTTIANWSPNTAAAKISYDNDSAKFAISDVGSDVWHIQLTQTPVALKAGETYQASFKVSSTSDRNIMWGVQHNGELDGGKYTGYCGGEEVAVSSEEKVITETFTMNTDDKLCTFYVSMGKMVSGKDAVGTVTISEPVLKRIDTTEAGANLLKNADFSAEDSFENWVTYLANWEGGPGAAATFTAEDGAALVDISNVGTAEWNVQLKQTPIKLVKGNKYKATVKLASTIERDIIWGVQHNGGAKAEGGDDSNDYRGYCEGKESVKAEQEYTKTFVVNDDDDYVTFYVSMGKITGGVSDNSIVTISGLKLEKVDDEDSQEDSVEENLIKNADFSAGISPWIETIAIPAWGAEYTADATNSIADGAITYDIKNAGSADWHVNLKQTLDLESGKTYKVTFDIISTIDRTVKCMVQDNKDGSIAYPNWDNTAVALKANTKKSCTIDFTLDKDTKADLAFSMGQIDSEAYGNHQITISNIKFVEK